MIDPALSTALFLVRDAHKAVERAYISFIGTRHTRRAHDAAVNLREAADRMAGVLLELEMVRPVGGEMHVPPEEAA